MLLESLLATLLLGQPTGPSPLQAERWPAQVLVAAQSTPPDAATPAVAQPAAPGPKPTPVPRPTTSLVPAEPPPAQPPAQALTAPEVRELVARMQKFYEVTEDFRADFTQEYQYKVLKRTQISHGTVLFKKPGLMRWEYQRPSPRTFVLAGDKVYAYDPAAMTLTKAAVATDQLSASVTFLFGVGKLEDEFAIRKVECPRGFTCLGTRLELTPKKTDPRFKKIFLEVDPKTAQVHRSTVVDPDGSENAITFERLRTNTQVSTEAFKLTPPEGTQVIDYTQAGRK
jgi:outer membrane lipoprotein carrier protein